MELEDKVEQLERENFMLKNNKTDQFSRKSQTESEQIIKDLSQQNAKLRLKICDLSEKIQQLEGEAA
jgi:predicted RNase H-like nuclease (RuvC/YqgF family)